MFSRFRDHFGTGGLIVAVAALVIALTGGAYAATGGLTGKQKKEVEKIAKKVTPKGTMGPAGPAGPTGPAGAPGPAGAAGTNGKSPAVAEVPLGEPECEERGGITVDGNEICNGEEGPEGQPWTPNNTLPAGAVETGTWSLDSPAGEAVGAIAFPIQLKQPLESGNVHYSTDADYATFCKNEGVTEIEVLANGNLCVLQRGLFNGEMVQISKASSLGSKGADKSGAMMIFEMSSAGFGWGLWAVKGM